MLKARRVYHNQKKLIPDCNDRIKEALTLLENSTTIVNNFLFF